VAVRGLSAGSLFHKLIDLIQNSPHPNDPHIMSSDVLRSATATSLLVHAVLLLDLFDLVFQLLQTVAS